MRDPTNTGVASAVARASMAADDVEVTEAFETTEPRRLSSSWYTASDIDGRRLLPSTEARVGGLGASAADSSAGPP